MLANKHTLEYVGVEKQVTEKSVFVVIFLSHTKLYTRIDYQLNHLMS